MIKFKVFCEDEPKTVGFTLDGLTLSMVPIKGKHPTLGEVENALKCFLNHIIDTSPGELSEVQEYKRINPWRISLEQTSCEAHNIFIEYIQDIDGFDVLKKKFILHISCAGKVAQIDAFLPDVLAALDFEIGASPNFGFAVRPPKMKLDGTWTVPKGSVEGE